MHWLQDVDNVYGYGTARQVRGGPTDTGPSYINTFQRGPQESVWETVPHPTCDNFKYGGTNGYLDLFTEDARYAKQWKYTNAPDADARAVQAAYWADVWAKQQGKRREVVGDRRQGRQDGRLPAVRHVRQVLQEDRQLRRPDRPAPPAAARTARTT